MAINFNGITISNMYIGNTLLNKAYLGSTLVFERTPVIPSTLLDGIQHYYKLDNELTDWVGSDDATISNMTYQTGKINDGVKSTNTSARLTLSPDGANGWHSNIATLSMWVKLPTNNSQSIWDMAYTSHVDPYYAQEIRMHSSGTFLIASNNGSYQGWLTTTTPPTGEFFHIVVVFNGGNMKLYLNGEYKETNGLTPGTTTFSNTPVLVGDILNIPNIYSTNVEYDEIGYWDRELTASEVNQLYFANQGNQYPFSTANPLTAGLTSYYKLDETSGTVASDSVGSINGTLNEGAFSSNGKINYGYDISSTSGTYGIRFGASNHSLVNNEPKTYNAWFKPDSANTTMVFFSNMDATTKGFYLARNTSGQLYYRIASTNTIGISSTSGPLVNTVGKWYMITMVYDGTGLDSGVHVYVDGVEGSFTNTDNDLGSNSITTTNQFSLSSYSVNGSLSMQGETDEFGVWDRVLSEYEISELYNNSNANQYPFESYQPNIFPDLEFAYSFKKRVATATKSFRIRRSNDNAETDVLLDDVFDCSINSLVSDGGTLADWIGSNSGYVVTDYDQVGNHDVTQATQSKQPKVVNAGTWLGYKEYAGAQTLVGTTQVTDVLGSAYVYATTPSGSQYFISQAKAGDNDIFGLSMDGTTITKKIRTLDFKNGTNNVCVGTLDVGNGLNLMTYRSNGSTYTFRTNSDTNGTASNNNGAWFGDHTQVGDVIQKGGINWSSQLYSTHNEYESLVFTVTHTDAQSQAVEDSIRNINPL